MAQPRQSRSNIPSCRCDGREARRLTPLVRLREPTSLSARTPPTVRGHDKVPSRRARLVQSDGEGVVVSSEEREAPTLAELLRRLADLRPADAAAILARATPAPLHPPPETGGLPPPPRYASWDDFLTRTTLAERRRWCAQKAGKANRERLMSGRPETKITTVEVWTVLEAAQGRCHHCGSLAVERRPSAANGAPVPWSHIGRRIGSLGHLLSRFHGGSNTMDNLVWSCLWCNTWQTERTARATDHGAYHPQDG